MPQSRLKFASVQMNGFWGGEVCGRYMEVVVFFDVLEIIKLIRKRIVDKAKL